MKDKLTNRSAFKVPIIPDIYTKFNIQTVSGCALADLHLHVYIEVSPVCFYRLNATQMLESVLFLCLFGHVVILFGKTGPWHPYSWILFNKKCFSHRCILKPDLHHIQKIPDWTEIWRKCR